MSDHHGRAAMTVIMLGAFGSLAMLFTFNPAEGGLFPPCFFRALTGLSCPGCGALRGTHELLHGEVAAAWSHNPLWLVTAPLAGGALLWASLRAYGVPLPELRVPRRGLWGMLLAVVAFGVLRNL